MLPHLFHPSTDYSTSEKIPLFLQLSATCDPAALFDLGVFEYSIFNTQHNCCNPRAPILPLPGAFPYVQ